MKRRTLKQSTSIFAAAIMALAIMASPQESQATTFANTDIVNNVTVAYKSLGNVAYSASATVTVKVNLVPAAPTLTYVSATDGTQNPDTLPLATDEQKLVTQTYRISSTMNGLAQYKFDAATYGPTNISAATNAARANVFLGATNVGVPAALGATVIYVPLDTYTGSGSWTYTATNSSIGGVNGIVAGDYIVINNQRYLVNAVDNSTTAASALPADYQQKFAKITLDAGTPLAAAVLPGDQVGESQDITVTMTTGTLNAGQTQGDYTTSLTAKLSDNSNSVTEASSADRIYVARCDLTITKSVSTDGTNYTASSLGTNTSAGTLTGVTTNPATQLFYRITVASTNTGKKCQNVVITDNLSPYVAFKVVNTALPTGALAVTTTGTGLTFTGGTTDTYLNQANTLFTPASGGGSAPADFDARVHQMKLDFGAQQMNAGTSLIINYSVWIF